MSTQTRRSDLLRTEIFRNRFQGIVDEMGQMLMRAAHTVFVKETQDFVVALVTPQGEVFAASRKVGIWIAIGMPFAQLLTALSLAPGEVGITNSPDATHGLVTHLPDVFLWKPVFHQGQLICYAAAFVHCTDIGGAVPGSIALASSELRQEGIELLPNKLIAGGQLNESLLTTFVTNSRIPEQNRGDLMAMVAALDKAETRIAELAGRYGYDEVMLGITEVLNHAESQARTILSVIPDGQYHFVDYLEGDFLPDQLPVRIELTLHAHQGAVELDFTGTDPQVQASLNLTTYSQHGHYLVVLGLVNFMRTINPEITYNSGMVRPVRVRIPRGTVLNPMPGAACGTRQATFFRVADVVQGAIARALPDRVPAAGAGQGAILLISIPDLQTGEDHISTVQPLVGGSGARPGRDGTDGVDFITGFYRNIPTEILECDMPLIVERYGLRPDSAGAGRFRGGTGIEYSVRIMFPGAVITARGLERFHFSPWGRKGGLTGASSRILCAPPGEAPTDIGKIDVLRPQHGAVVTFLTPGGGGWADPFTRDPALVLGDVRQGLVSPEAARELYGVAVVGGAVNPEETARLRTRPRAEAPEFSFGPYREQYEAEVPAALQGAVNRAVAGRPPVAQRFFRERLIDGLRRRPDAGTDDVNALFAELVQSFRLEPQQAEG